MDALGRVVAWRELVRGLDPATIGSPLSPAGVRAALDAALEPLTDDALARAASVSGRPFSTACVVVARTVFTAPLEWCAVLLARGTAVVVKHPEGAPGLAPHLVAAAREVGLPLGATADRTAVFGPELLVAMGNDDTIGALSGVPAERALLFGARFSIAWVREVRSLEAVAADAALHDGRGCMSPVAVATPLPFAEVLPALAAAMANAERAVPRGAISAWEAARIRDRRALARAVGQAVEGPGWAAHGLPPDRFDPTALPRVLAVHTLPDLAAFTRWIGPAAAHLSTVATDDPSLLPGEGARGPILFPGARVVPVGAAQRPPLDRLHDGVDWLRQTVR
ncbi:MAG: acyl-CoA reductase [Myxococcota bacterium]